MAIARERLGGQPAFNESIVHGQFFSGLNVPCRPVDSIAVDRKIRKEIGLIAVIEKPCIIAAQNVAVQTGVDIPIVQESISLRLRLVRNACGVKIEVKSGGELPDGGSLGNFFQGEDAQRPCLPKTLRLLQENHFPFVGPAIPLLFGPNGVARDLPVIAAPPTRQARQANLAGLSCGCWSSF